MPDDAFGQVVGGQVHFPDAGAAQLLDRPLQQGRSPTGSIGLGICSVRGSRRLPKPPAMITAERFGSYLADEIPTQEELDEIARPRPPQEDG